MLVPFPAAVSIWSIHLRTKFVRSWWIDCIVHRNTITHNFFWREWIQRMLFIWATQYSVIAIPVHFQPYENRYRHLWLRLRYFKYSSVILSTIWSCEKQNKTKFSRRSTVTATAHMTFFIAVATVNFSNWNISIYGLELHFWLATVASQKCANSMRSAWLNWAADSALITKCCKISFNQREQIVLLFSFNLFFSPSPVSNYRFDIILRVEIMRFS